ncbi:MULTISPECIES: protein phosphatase 2C domain-containing protein [unclassified Streptomyces]|uniref:protein phosphatase 2C domain-containing protein n=1 Tax=unclassified Streptomyces TaxID=2593676 RepID=UPI00336A0DA3
MSEQGDRRRHEDDWWGELYRRDTDDAGPASAADSVDDRFDSASSTVGGAPPPTGPPPGPPPRSAPAPGAPWGPRPPGEEGEPDGSGVPGGSAASDGPGAPGGPGRPARSGEPFGWFSGRKEPGPGGGDPGGVSPEGPGEGPDGGPGAGPTAGPGAGAAAAERPSEARPPQPQSPQPQPPQAQPPTHGDEPVELPLADPYDLADLVPDTVLDGARCGAATLRVVSSRGESARQGGEPRRDAVLTARFGAGPGALVLVALAGGAGGAEGAYRAARELCEWIGGAVGRSHARLVDDIRAGNRGALKSGLHRLTDRGLGRLRARAAELGVDPAEYTAAPRCLLLSADPACRTRVFFGAGDGGVFRLRAGAWQDLEPAGPERDSVGGPVVGYGGAARPGAHAAEAPAAMGLGLATPGTGPAPGPPPVPAAAPFRFRASIARPGDVLLMCGGGLAGPLRGRPALAGHLAERWAQGGPPGLAAFLADIRTRVHGYAGYADDRTAAAVWEA